MRNYLDLDDLDKVTGGADCNGRRVVQSAGPKMSNRAWQKLWNSWSPERQAQFREQHSVPTGGPCEVRPGPRARPGAEPFHAPGLLRW